MEVPWAYLRLTQAWSMSCRQARQLWQALAHAQGPAAVSWREALWQCKGSPGVPLATLLAHWTPQEVLAVLDTLRCERQLSRVTRVQVEERILAQVDGTGRWVGLAAVEPERGIDLASTIEQYWR
jgi:hypothetical protein